MTTLKGLVLKEIDSGEASKSICVLTAESGVIYIYVRGGRKSTKTTSATQAFSYSTLCYEEKKNAKGQVSRYLNSSEPVKLFYNIRLDAAKVALASYFSELIIYSGTEGEEYGDVLRLALNTLYFLDEDKMPADLLKCVFEFRLMCEIGFMPKLVGCTHCFKYEDEKMHFNFLEDELECDECCMNPDSGHSMILDKMLLYVVRYIALTDFEKLFYFKISDRYLKKLNEFTERYVSYHLKHRFGALDFYKMLK
ncbi:MAG: DNA repair protein RecO [Ruminococcus sp.]|nr:DNA repair protein RecO [Ruminococcus sp.]